MQICCFLTRSGVINEIRFTKNYLKLMFEKTSVSKSDKNIFLVKTCKYERNIVNLEISRGPHTLGKHWLKVKYAVVAHQQGESIDALGRFSV